MAPGGAQMGEWRRFRGLQDRGIRRPAEALTSHYPLRGGVDLSFESVLRHQIKVQFRGHFGGVPEWPIFLPPWIIARLSRVAFLEALEDDVETGGDGPVPVFGGVLVAATGGGVGMA